MRTLCAFAVSLLLLQEVCAQQPVPSDREALMRGDGMGLAAYAERNGFPGPKHVLELKDTLHLTSEQIDKSEVLVARVRELAQKLGGQIVREEERLNGLFVAQGTLEEDEIQEVLRRIGALRADLRFVHLQAHLDMKEALTPEQRHLYALLRGHETRHH